MKRRDDRKNRRTAGREPRVELDEELAFHVEERVRYYMERGLDESAARRAALERMGDLGDVEGECVALLEAERRASVRRRWVNDVRQDVRFAVRTAVRSPFLTFMAVATLALGVGANAAVFGVVKSVLLDALPYEDGDRLVRVYAAPVGDPGARSPLSAGVVADVVERQHSFDRLASFYTTVWDAIYRPAGGARVEKAALVEPGFFDVLGVRPALGRGFTGEQVEARLAGDEAGFVVVLSDAFWRREFGADPGIVGTTIRVDGNTWVVTGVLPRGFIGPMGDADLWFGLNPRSGLDDPVRSRQAGQLGLVGRLRDGVTRSAAARDVAAIADALAMEHPATDGDRTMTVVAIRDSMVGDARLALLALMASAALVLVIACANLGGALLSRTLARQGEFALRAALGAGRGRLIRQLVTEATLLSAAGAVAGLGLAAAGLAVLRRLELPALPAWADLSLDAGAAGVMILVALFCALLIAMAPVLTAGAASPQATLRESSVSGGLRSGRLRGFIVAAQIALCLSLLTGASLLARSLIAMTSRPPGYDPDRVLTVAVKGPVPALDADRRRFFEQLERNVASLPGVMGVATTNGLPGSSLRRMDVASPVDASGAATENVPVANVSDGYFATMRIPILAGRAFGPGDGPESPQAVVVSESLARRHWPRGDAVGARIRLGTDTATPPAVVVGIAGEVRSDPARETAQPMVYTTSRQALLREVRTYVVRTAGDPRDLIRPFRERLEALDPTVPMDDVATLRELRDAQVSPRRLPAVMLTSFAGLALLLACVGVYALFAALAVSRTREFGIRIALGSSPRAIAGLALRQAASWMVGGLAAGAVGALATASALRGLLFGVSPIDPLSLLLAIAVLLAFGAVAILVPIRRMIRIDPRTIMT